MPVKKALYDNYHHGSTSSTPGDATTYYWGNSYGGLDTNAGPFKIYILRSGVIENFQINFTSGVVPTNETWDIVLRVNNTTDYTVKTAIGFDGVTYYVAANVSGLNIIVNKGDYFCLKMLTPTWVTNPTNLKIGGIVSVRRG